MKHINFCLTKLHYLYLYFRILWYRNSGITHCLIIRITTSWRGERLGYLLLQLAQCSIPSEQSVILFYILFVIVCNLPVLRETYFFMGISSLILLKLEEKPIFVFNKLYNSGVFPSTHPLCHILQRLIQVDKENKRRCQAESTFDWDLFLVNLLVKITAYCFDSFIISLSIYHSSKSSPTMYVGLSSSPIVLQLLYYSLLSVLQHKRDYA